MMTPLSASLKDNKLKKRERKKQNDKEVYEKEPADLG